MRYTTDDMRNFAGKPQFDFGVKFAIKEAADEIDRLRGALGEIASGLSVRDPFEIANETLKQ